MAGTRAAGKTLRDLLGWSRRVSPDDIAPTWLNRLRNAKLLRDNDDGTVSATVRVSSLNGGLFYHSAFPPSQEDAVFFGPDTYRFARLLEQELDGARVDLLVDLGAGSGAGAFVVHRGASVRQLLLLDVSPRALHMSKVNLDAAGLQADYQVSDGLTSLQAAPDLIIANPPFIAGSSGRTYRDGGDMHGARLSFDWTVEGAKRLRPGGRFILYTGSAIVDGVDELSEALANAIDPDRYELAYRQLDPDILGGQLACAGYDAVERIAAVAAVVTKHCD